MYASKIKLYFFREWYGMVRFHPWPWAHGEDFFFAQMSWCLWATSSPVSKSVAYPKHQNHMCWSSQWCHSQRSKPLNRSRAQNRVIPKWKFDTEVSWNRGTPKSSMWMGFSDSIINHPFWGTPIYGNLHTRKWPTSVFPCVCQNIDPHPKWRWRGCRSSGSPELGKSQRTASASPGQYWQGTAMDQVFCNLLVMVVN